MARLTGLTYHVIAQLKQSRGGTNEAPIERMGRRSKVVTIEIVKPNNMLELFNEAVQILSHLASTLMYAANIIRTSS